MARIVVAEDDELQSALVRSYLEREGHDVVLIDRGDRALEVVRRDPPRLLVLDVMLPGMDGLAVCRTLREDGLTLPVLMLTARATENDLLLGLELGADDYLTKPYSPRELVARIRALLRRTPPAASGAAAGPGGGPTIVGDLSIDGRRRIVQVSGVEVVLTRAEFELLDELALHRDAVLTRSQLLSRLHGFDEFISERTIDAHVKNLRGKIEADPARPTRLITVYGVGYRLVAVG